LAEGLKKWKEEKALKLLKGGRVPYFKAAEIAGMSVWEFVDLIRKEDVVWIKSEKMIEEDIKKAPTVTTIVFNATPLKIKSLREYPKTSKEEISSSVGL
jgi:hypothetical protein